MFVFIPCSIPPVRFWPVATDPREISNTPVTYLSHNNIPERQGDYVVRNNKRLSALLLLIALVIICKIISDLNPYKT